MSFTPYLSFQGECAEAFSTYGRIFGATPTISRFSDAPASPDLPSLPDEQKNWVMHAQILTSDGAMLMGADMPPQFGGQKQAGISVAVWRANPDEARRIFDSLAEGGDVTMPFGPTFFAQGFGICRDRFGTSWMVSTGDPAATPAD
ncbi:MAG: VOC family protein [Paracoccus sp. (in: a-proteobacteria)]